ncbi:hypothetical protein H9P43_000765 [Blastocladiella emersonii ATCC 22665]|nr:hypothetical protein H9P43_000765 [Blastocladiella emersonii ATCC 22665]
MPTSPRIDLTSDNRVRAKKYAAAHHRYVSNARQCKLAHIREPWDILRSKGPIITSALEHHENEKQQQLLQQALGDAERRRLSTASNISVQQQQQREAALLSRLLEIEDDDDESEAGESGAGLGLSHGPADATATFLTGTQIVEPVPPPPPELEDLDLERYFAEFRMPGGPSEWDAPLPDDIQTTTRLLRLALHHPAHYWRVVDPGFARATAASKARTRPSWKRAFLDATYGRRVTGGSPLPLRSTNLNATNASSAGFLFGNGATSEAEAERAREEEEERELEEALAEDPGLRSPAHSTWSDGSLGDAPSARAAAGKRHGGNGPIRGVRVVAVGGMGGAGGGGGLPAKFRRKVKVHGPSQGGGSGDGMEDVRGLMKKVHYKLQLLEAEMARLAAEEAKRKRERDMLRNGGSRLFYGSKLGTGALGGMSMLGSKLGFQLGNSRAAFLGGSRGSKMGLAGGGGSRLALDAGGSSSRKNSGSALHLPQHVTSGLAMQIHGGNSSAPSHAGQAGLLTPPAGRAAAGAGGSKNLLQVNMLGFGLPRLG